MKEIWKDIPQYEGLYQASTLGRIRAKDRVIAYTNRWGGTSSQLHNGHLVPQHLSKEHESPLNGTSYYSVKLYKNNKMHNEWVHRLVALTFIDNPEHYPCVNHKNEDKGDNSVDNLEWCSYKYNNTYGSSQSLKRETYIKNGTGKKVGERMKGTKNPAYTHRERNNFVNNNPTPKKPIFCVETGIIYASACDASKETGIIRANISNACNNKQKTAGGYHWQFINF